MIATTAKSESGIVATLQTLTVANAEKAISLVNRWLHRDVGFFIHVSRAVLDPVTSYWRLPVELAYPQTGSLGVIGEVYLNAADGQFVERPTVEELQQRATELAHAHGITEDDNGDEEA